MTRARGFTLVEVLVALVIVAIGMAALLGTLSSAADTSIYLRDKTFAEWIALNRISELRLAAKRPTEGKSAGEFDYAGRKWRYQQEIAKTDIPGILRIDVSVAEATAPAGKDSKAGKDWTVVASGVTGDALGPPNGVDPDWNGAAFPGAPGAAGTQGGGPGETPGTGAAPSTSPAPSPGGPLPTS